MPAPTVFISYSHQDEAWNKRLLPHLRALETAGFGLQIWHDRRIDGGDKWYPEIQDAMANAAAAILLISSDFLASPFCVFEEVPALLKRQEETTGARTGSTSSPQAGPESAQSDLDEAWEIAERGPMPLFLADIHLHRARLFFREANYPWESPQKDLAEARRLIEKCSYWRRKEELEDAELAILGKSTK